MSIEVANLGIRQGKFALAGISFAVPTGQFAVLMGKSGCGKTTLLEAIAGLRPLFSGTVRLAGRDATRLRPAERRIGYVPQDAALFDTMTVRDNLGFALAVSGTDRAAMAKRIDELADRLEIGDLLERWPHDLSGGEKQRVALGRALAARPPVLLLDEPLSSLDDETRDSLTGLLDRLRQSREATILHVTHHRMEAERLADCVFRIENGELEASLHSH